MRMSTPTTGNALGKNRMANAAATIDRAVAKTQNAGLRSTVTSGARSATVKEALDSTRGVDGGRSLQLTTIGTAAAGSAPADLARVARPLEAAGVGAAP